MTIITKRIGLEGIKISFVIQLVTVASGSVVDGDDDLQEDIRSGASGGGGAPSRDFSCGTNRAGRALSEKGATAAVLASQVKVPDTSLVSVSNH